MDAGQKTGWKVGLAQALIGRVEMKEVDGEEEWEVVARTEHQCYGLL